MPTYVMLTKLTAEGKRSIKAHPNRTEEVNREIEGLDARVVAQYALLGPYDYLTIIEAPDNETIARVSVELGSRGSIDIITMPALDTSRFP